MIQVARQDLHLHRAIAQGRGKMGRQGAGQHLDLHNIGKTDGDPYAKELQAIDPPPAFIEIEDVGTDADPLLQYQALSFE